MRPAIVDFLVLAALLAGLNVFADPGDPGWHSVNPCPYLMLPAFIGCRYGFTGGLLAGILTAAGIGAAIVPDIGHAGEALFGSRFLLASFPLSGMLTGEMTRRLGSRLEEVTAKLDVTEESEARLRSDLEIAEESRHLLQQRLVVLGAGGCALDTQLRTLLAPGTGAALANLLALLRDVAGVERACVAKVSSDGARLEVIASLASEYGEGASFAVADVPIVAAALESGESQRWRQECGDGAPLYAVPWRAPEAKAIRGVVVIERMEFLSVSVQHFARIDAVVRWTARHLDPAEAATSEDETRPQAPVVSPEAFEQAVSLARETFEKTRLPSTIIVFEAEAGAEPVSPDTLLRHLQAELRPPRVATFQNEGGRAKLALLLPMEGASDAAAVVAAARRSLNGDGDPSRDSIRGDIIVIPESSN